MEKIYDGVSAVVEKIGPLRAREYKDTMPRNRRLRHIDVRRYMDDMTTCASCGKKMDGHEDAWACTACGGRASRWRLTGEPFVFDWFGQLIEGGHRVEAILRSGATIETMVVRGVDPEARKSMNDGVKRTFGDDLVMAGQTGSSQCSGLMRKIAYWEQAAERNSGRGGLAGIRRFTISRGALSEMWPVHEKEINTALHVLWKWAPSWPGNVGALLFIAWLLDHEGNNPAVIEKFLAIIANGSQDTADRPLIQCRQKISPENITRYRREKGEYGIEYDVFWLMRAWNGWLRGERNTKFSLPQGGLADPYPKLIRAR